MRKAQRKQGEGETPEQVGVKQEYREPRAHIVSFDCSSLSPTVSKPYKKTAMKLSIIALFSTLALSSAFAPNSSSKQSAVVMNAEADQSRKAFLSTAAATLFGVAAAAPAFAMDQELWVSVVS